MTTTAKKELVAELNDKFKSAIGVVHADYRGIKAANLDILRASMRAGNVEFKVVKNRLAKLAAKGTPLEKLSENFRGPTSLAISYDSPTSAAKIITDFSKKEVLLKVIAGMAEGDLFDEKGVKKIGSLPEKPTLQAQFLNTLQGGPRSFVCVLNGALNKFVYLLNAVKEKREKDIDFKEGDKMADITTEDVKKYLNGLSVLKLVELTKELEEEWGVSAAAPVVTIAGSAEGEAGATAEKEKTEFTVVLSSIGEKKIQVIKAVREITTLGLKEAKELVDGAPRSVKEKLNKEEAEQIKAKLEETGATVELK